MSTANQSPELTAFYRAYRDWAYRDGAPQGQPFSRRSGLCYNLDVHVDGHISPMFSEMDKQFRDAGLDPNYPFQPMEDYEMFSDELTQHLCPVRRAWVEEHAK